MYKIKKEGSFFLFGDNEMAISKLMYMKETAGNPARHLKRAIEYVMNPEEDINRRLFGFYYV